MHFNVPSLAESGDIDERIPSCQGNGIPLTRGDVLIADLPKQMFGCKTILVDALQRTKRAFDLSLKRTHQIGTDLSIPSRSHPLAKGQPVRRIPPSIPRAKAIP